MTTRTPEELAAIAISTAWECALEEDTPSWWDHVRNDLNGMKTLAIYAGMSVEFRDCLSTLWNVSLTRGTMAAYK